MAAFYLWPALSALLYAFAAILTKRALESGAGVVRFTFLCNLAFVLVFVPPALLEGQPLAWEFIGWPILGGCFFFLGQILTVAALRLGDVSVQSPLMGSKVVFVALISALAGTETIGPSWWSGAGLTAIAVFLLGFSNWRQNRRTWISVGLALGSAAAFAVSDVLTMAKAQALGVANYLAVVICFQAALSLTIIPLFRQPLHAISRAAWPWLAGACLLMGLQAFILNTAIGVYGHATPFNVIYSSRGLWSVLIIGAIGVRLGNVEFADGGRLLAGQRLLGACLLLVAVGLVLFGGS